MSNSHSKLLNLFLSWLPFAVAITLLSGLIYVTTQQNYRMTANDPQIQMAEDAAVMLATGQQPQLLMSNAKVDIAKSLAPYLTSFDENGKPVATTAELNGRTPVPPDGVFDYTREHGEDRITWQPQPGVRSAAVIVYYKGVQSGFVLAGRSLREVEIREAQLTNMVAIAWIFILLATFAVNAFLRWIRQKYSLSA